MASENFHLNISYVSIVFNTTLFVVKIINNDSMENMATEAYSEGDVDDIDVIVDSSTVFEIMTGSTDCMSVFFIYVG